MQEKLTLNKKEQNRLLVLNRIERKGITVDQAALLLELSPRHVWRLLTAYRKEGAFGLAHGNRGRVPYNRVNEEIRQEVMQLAISKYTGFNQQHFTEKLKEKEGIQLSRSTVRRILLKQGIRSPQKRRPPKHRRRRECYPQSGMLLQTDGSPHDWLEGRGPKLCLIGAIDDATGEVPYCLFQEQEDTKGYMLMLKEIVMSRGIPLAIYHDRHSIFEVTQGKESTIEEQLSGQRPLTQIGRIMKELGINSIPANSPQAKGRIERLWKTFQDRLASELRLAGVRTKDDANRILQEFLLEYNRKFVVAAREPGSAYRQLPDRFKSDEVFCYKYPRTVGNDNVVRFMSCRFQILPDLYRLSYARCKVEIYAGLNGELAVYYNKRRLDTCPASQESSRRRIPVTVGQSAQRIYSKPSPNHPWRRSYKAYFD